MLIKKEKIPIKKIVTIGILPSFLKKFYYRLKGYKIGSNVSIGPGSVIIGDNVIIGNDTKIGFMTVIRAKRIQIGRFVTIGSMTMIDTERFEIDDDSRINEQVIIGGIKNPDSYIKIGKRTIIMEYSFINPTKPIIIGDDTGIGGHCLLFTHGSWLSQLDGYPVTFAPITLGENVWLPWRVFIMPGVAVGDNVVIGANSLVSKNLPSNCLAAGSPAKIIKDKYPPDLSDLDKQNIIEYIFAEFIKYLEYYQFSVNKYTLTQHDFNLKIKNKNSNSELYYQTSIPEKIIPTSKNNLLVINYKDTDLEKYLGKFSMVLDLVAKRRIGSSMVGEEYVSYISRFGIRPDRLD